MTDVATLADDRDFLTDVVDKIEGWLNRSAAHLTMDLLRDQRGKMKSDALLEIGAYRGKYLAVLLNEARASGAAVMTVDTFEFLTPEDLVQGLRNHFGDVSYLRVHKGPSDGLKPSDYIERLGGKPRFISIDGSHMAPDVLHDLNLAAEIGASGCVVAVDDFANTMTLGVNEAVARFLMAGGGRQLSPFCFCANKLFMCRPEFRPLYLQWTERFVRDHAEYPGCQQFVDLERKWRGAVEIEYFGSTLLNVNS